VKYKISTATGARRADRENRRKSNKSDSYQRAAIWTKNVKTATGRSQVNRKSSPTQNKRGLRTIRKK